MPRFYRYAGQPVEYNAIARTYGTGARAAETKSLGDRYTGPILSSDLGAIGGSKYLGSQDLGNKAYGELGRSKYLGGQDLGSSMFGGQDKDLSLGAAMLSDNEKRLVTIGVIGLVGWFFFGDKIKKAMK